MLCVNTSWIATKSYTYKSEEFLVIELLKRGLNIPIWNLLDLEDQELPPNIILIDDACYSGSQLRTKTNDLTDFPDNKFHLVVAYASNNCMAKVEAAHAENVVLHVGEIIQTAGEVTGDNLDWLTPSTFELENRSLKQSSSNSAKLCLSTPEYKIVDEKSTFTAYFAELTQTKSIKSEHYKQWTKKL